MTKKRVLAHRATTVDARVLFNRCLGMCMCMVGWHAMQDCAGRGISRHCQLAETMAATHHFGNIMPCCAFYCEVDACPSRYSAPIRHLVLVFSTFSSEFQVHLLLSNYTNALPFTHTPAHIRAHMPPYTHLSVGFPSGSAALGLRPAANP